MATRPDISYIVSRLSQYLDKPTPIHLTGAKHVLRYLKGSISQSLIFKKSTEPLKLRGFCDADWAGSSDRKSISGYCLKLSDESSIISWKSKKQPVVSLSTCEAEFVSLASAGQEALYLRTLLKSVVESGVVNNPVTIYCDNQSSILLAKNPIIHQRSKHIDIKYQFIRDEIKKGSILLKYIESEKNIADLFTKPWNKIKLNTFQKEIMGGQN